MIRLHWKLWRKMVTPEFLTYFEGALWQKNQHILQSISDCLTRVNGKPQLKAPPPIQKPFNNFASVNIKQCCFEKNKKKKHPPPCMIEFREPEKGNQIRGILSANGKQFSVLICIFHTEIMRNAYVKLFVWWQKCWCFSCCCTCINQIMQNITSPLRVN